MGFFILSIKVESIILWKQSKNISDESISLTGVFFPLQNQIQKKCSFSVPDGAIAIFCCNFFLPKVFDKRKIDCHPADNFVFGHLGIL